MPKDPLTPPPTTPEGIEAPQGKPVPTRCGVHVLTWGTDSESSNGMGHFLDTKFFGGNVGHAAIQLVFPANEEGDRLVREYCSYSQDGSHRGLPYVKRRYATPSLNTQQEAYTEEVYEVYWSWWPAVSGFALSPDIDRDRTHEREGVAFEWDPRWEAIMEPEKRRHRGNLGQKKMLYAPHVMLHLRQLGDDSSEENIQNQLALEMFVKMESWDHKKKSLDILKEKLQLNGTDKGFLRKLSTTEKNLLDYFITGWQKLIPDTQNLSKIDIEKLVSLLDNIKEKEKSYYETIQHLVHLEDQPFILGPLERLKHANEVPVLKDEAIDDLLDYLSLYQDFIGFFGKDATTLEGCRTLEDNEPLSPTQCEFLAKAIERYNKAVKEEPRNESYCKALDAMSSIIDIYDALDRQSDTKPIMLDDDLIKDIEPFLDHVEWKHFIETDESGKKWISIDHLKKLIDLEKPLYDNLRKDLRGYSNLMVSKFDNTFEALMQRHLSIGSAPDHRVHLPVAPFEGASGIGLKDGLNIENMLKKMRELSRKDSESFDLYGKNCSKTSDAILEAGATQDHQKDFFRSKAMGFFGNPQETLNHAMLFQSSLHQKPKGLIRRVLGFSPLQSITHACMRNIMEPSKHRTLAVGSILMLVGLSPLITLRFLTQRLLDPLGTFRMANSSFNFAQSRDFKGPYKLLQGLMLLGTAAVSVAFSPLALLQWTLGRASTGVSSLFKKTAPTKKSLPETQDFSEETTRRLSDQQQALSEAEFLKKINQLIIYIKEKHPATILSNFSKILQDEPNAIPVLTHQSRHKLHQFFEKHPGHELEKEYHALCQQTQARVLQLQKRLSEGESLSIGTLNLEKGKLILHGASHTRHRDTPKHHTDQPHASHHAISEVAPKRRL